MRGIAEPKTRPRTLVVLLSLGLLVVVGAAVVLRARGAAPAPNLVLIVIDALRRDRVGAHGSALPTTPFLDSLARTGAVFDYAWAHAPQTFNSTAALLTSQPLPLLRVRKRTRDRRGRRQGPRQALADANTSLAEALAAGGYDTLAVFTNPHHDEVSGFAQGFRLWRFLPPDGAGRPYATAARVNQTFTELAAQLDPERPFFAYVHYMDVHNPYRPPPDTARLFVTTAGEDRYTNGRPKGGPPSALDLRFMQQLYAAGVRHVDDRIRELLEALGGLPDGRETIVVVTSDHGDEFLEHGGLGHGHSMHQELLRVPLLLHGGEALRGVRVERLARGIDVAPTLLDLAGLAPPPEFEGRSLLPLVRDAAGEVVPDGAGEPAPGELSFAWHVFLRAVTTERFHLLLDRRSGRSELYDARSDPEGRNDLAAEKPRVARELRRALRRFERRVEEAKRREVPLPATSRDDAVQRRTRAQLRALGYAE